MYDWYDEPHADTSACPTFLVSKVSKNFVTVALSGDGGDEIFGGYKRYQYRSLDLSRFGQIFKLKKNLIRLKSYFTRKSLPYRFINRLSEYFLDDIEYYAKKMNGLLKDEKMYYRSILNIENDYDDYLYYRKFWISELPYLNRLRYLDFKTYLPDDILTKVDRTSMSVSLEVRVPFLSKEIIEFCFSLPENLIFNNNELKGLIKEAYSDILPMKIISKEKKGFSIPSDYMPRKSTVQEFLLRKVFHRYMPSEIK